MTNGTCTLMFKVESIAECSRCSILQYFWPALRDYLVDSHKIMDEFEIWLDQSYLPLTAWKNAHILIMGEMWPIAPSFLNGSSSFLQIYMYGGRAWIKALIEFLISSNYPTIDYGVSCPQASEKLMFNVLASPALSSLSPDPTRIGEYSDHDDDPGIRLSVDGI